MPVLMGIDIETYSSAPLPRCGVYRYCDAPDFEILLFESEGMSGYADGIRQSAVSLSRSGEDVLISRNTSYCG